MRKSLFFCAIIALAFGCSKTEDEPTTTTAGGTTASSSNERTTPEVTFADLQPVIEQNCVKCHGEKPSEGIDLRTYESIMKGGEHGPIVVAGDPENSVIIQALRGSHGKKQMPMKADPLADDVIAKVEAWIKAGAKA